MIKLQHAYFQSRSSSGPPEHPAGEGWRPVLVFTDGEGMVHALSVSLLLGKTFSDDQWKAIRPLDMDFDPRRQLDRLTQSIADLTRQGVAFEKEPVEHALMLLRIANAPAPRVRTRERLNPPIPTVEGNDVAHDGVRPVETGDVHP